MSSAAPVICVNFVLALVFFSGTFCDQSDLKVISAENSTKVVVSLYTESLCPYCRQFIKDQLMPTWTNMSDYFDIDILPYGNAERYLDHKKWIIKCQHGPEECRLNMIEACAVKLYQKTNSTLLLRYLACVASNNDTDADQQCATEVNIPYLKIKKCANSKAGYNFMLCLAKRTEKQRPNLAWVPFVGFDGVLDRNEQELALSNLTAALCNHISGPKPSICDKKQKAIKNKKVNKNKVSSYKEYIRDTISTII